MPEWHTRCDDEACNYRCRRAGCINPGVHFFVKVHYENHRYVGTHSYDCTAEVSLARQAVEELRPGMAPDEIAIARRVLLDALDKLERAEKPRPSIYREEAG